MLTAIADEIRQKSRLEERLTLARKMKEEGLDYELISRITGLTIEEIAKMTGLSTDEVSKL